MRVHFMHRLRPLHLRRTRRRSRHHLRHRHRLLLLYRLWSVVP